MVWGCMRFLNKGVIHDYDLWLFAYGDFHSAKVLLLLKSKYEITGINILMYFLQP